MIYLIFPKLYHPALVLEQHGKIKMVTDVIFVFEDFNWNAHLQVSVYEFDRVFGLHLIY